MNRTRISLPSRMLLLGLLAVCGRAAPSGAAEGAPFQLSLRFREKQGEAFVERQRHEAWNPAETAVVICDMWDKHWCPTATARVAEMAPRMNAFAQEARRRGALIIHCPSDTMEFYKDTPMRRRAQAAPVVTPPKPLERWCKLDPAREAPLPIDDRDGGCDCGEPIKSFRAWSRQIATIQIEEADAITDSAEAYYLMRQRGIKQVLVMGVHTNMCVLGRPFSIRQMTNVGLKVALVRDLTDSMYNPERAPKVNHFRGTELVVEHIEKYWCPSVTSADLLGGPAFRFQDDPRPQVVLLADPGEYEADRTVPLLGQDLRERFGFDCQTLIGRVDAGRFTISGLPALDTADCLVLFVRRRGLPEEQLQLVRRYLAAGRPLVAIRTASHGFDPLPSVPEGAAAWPKFDLEVLGADYTGHGPEAAGTDVRLAEGAAGDPLFAGTEWPATWKSRGSLYFSKLLDPAARVLAWGRIEGREEPLVWTRRFGAAAVFATSLGHQDDFRQPHFRRLLQNAVEQAVRTRRGG